MTRKVVAGRQSGQRDREKKIEPVVSSRVKSTVGKFMRTFSRNKKKEIMTTYDDVDYFTALTVHVHSANCEYFGDAVLEAYTRGQQVGHMQDEVAAQKDALDKTADYGLELLLDLSAQWPWDNLLSNFPRLDTISATGTGAAGQVTIAHYEEATMADILQKMDKLELPVFLKKILEQVNFYFKVSEGWTDMNMDDIPSRYFIPRMPYNAATTNKTLINLIWAEQGELKNHCKKFGIKLEQFSVDWLKPREIRFDSEDGIAYLSHANLFARDGTGTGNFQVVGSYPMHVNDGENGKWWFKSDPNESVLNYLSPLYYNYAATYNIYGGCMNGSSLIASGADMLAVRCKFTEPTEMLACKFIDIIDIIFKYRKFWEEGAQTNVEIQGTEISNVDVVTANAQVTWPYATELDLYYGTGIDETSKDQTFLAWLISVMF